MDQYMQGDYMAFEALYLRHEKKVYTYLRKRLHDEQSQNEVFQNIFFKLHRCRQGYQNKYPFIKWLYTICRSELLDFCKAKKLPTIPFTEEIIAVTETNEPTICLEPLDGPNAKEKKAIRLRFYSDYDYKEISNALKTSEANARKLVSRGLKKLRAKLLGGQNE